VGTSVVIEDGSYHEVDSSDKAFQICAQALLPRDIPKTKPVLLEPIMKMEIECPESSRPGRGRSDVAPRHDHGHRSA
jgi:elongation factor G